MKAAFHVAHRQYQFHGNSRRRRRTRKHIRRKAAPALTGKQEQQKDQAYVHRSILGHESLKKGRKMEPNNSGLRIISENRKEKGHDHSGRSKRFHPPLQGSRLGHTRRRSSRLRKQRRLRGAYRAGKGRFQPQRTHPPAKGGRERFSGNHCEDQEFDSGSENKRDHSGGEETGGNAEAELSQPRLVGELYGENIPSGAEFIQSQERASNKPKP